ncbi:hypothetical protein BZB76_2450 [Actinomadura pelletieri DSM 43383]|uniref:Uncharacterized protein n=1 Tax=Actinomadura pelletieri DSM 43383 TaxID=1120940 RepID=A0A495QUB0_9ACTN|nr:hypothetical protein [Actinomadura pelletieri]RKS77079.1 hypothetical protein BZB76_2450 [Actinomadura pelletieri DSM 43383]
MPARQDGGALKGGAPRAVWCVGEHDPRAVSARSAAADLIKEDRPSHLVWHPGTGDIVQLLPATRAARLLGAPVGREGRVCVQIMVIGQSRVPFTGAPLCGLDAIVQWLDAWGVGRRWPAGPPLPSPQSYHASRGRKDWARGGHYGASQVPLLDRPDPGAIDIRRITGPDTPVAPIPKPRPRLPDPATTTRRHPLSGRAPEPVRPPQGDSPPPARRQPASGPVPVGPPAMSN